MVKTLLENYFEARFIALISLYFSFGSMLFLLFGFLVSGVLFFLLLSHLLEKKKKKKKIEYCYLMVL
jgi:hypothetical protein